MTIWLAILRAFEFLLLLANALLRERWKEEGRQEVRTKQKEDNAQASDKAAEIDARVSDAGIDALRERMRDYQRL
ncbi:MAG: hypothetical protein J0I48_22490 [Devosia sp.]|uniref:hypothetical protein n=1 Tax=Devosia sp. 66-22 TaxID=1895753 RepID=UPI0009296921|nr:hypothetical protein [Devosia sp. 66-22]MBN9348934.1 hypothetical protein [Devosia sp.]OJX54726.1 MAG: hypothetical protein BGO81_16535 [Devosia sp. 66-22]